MTKIIIILKNFYSFFPVQQVYILLTSHLSNDRSIECFILKIQQVLYMRAH